jgi:hypothetical protein
MGINRIQGNGAKSHFSVAFSDGFGFTFSRCTSSYYFLVSFGIERNLYCEDSSQYDSCVMGYRYKRRLVHYTENEDSMLPLNIDTYVPFYTDLYSRRIQSLSLLLEFQVRGCTIVIYKISHGRPFLDANFPTLDAKLESVFEISH